MTTDTATATRQWLSTGATYHEGEYRAQVEEAIAELEWHTPDESGPMSPVLMLQEIIHELKLRPVVGIAWGGCLTYPDGPWTAYYGLVAVEVRTRKQHFRGYWLDAGGVTSPLCLDWFEGRPQD